MVYKCWECGSEVRKEELDALGHIKCPKCGCRILYKPRPPVVKRVKAR